ncbi:MAG: twin-arginine translocase TatA/TatE family subunit [Anaerolineae bacterium]|nr:twin-arginine translocase TatA/TatE family subunit [Anaerolineae bacterium]
MDFLNIGSGEFLVLIFLALILFGPEDLVKIARTLGRMTRKAQNAWLQVSSSLQSEVMPDEVRATLDEVKSSVGKVTSENATAKLLDEREP